MKVKIHKLSFNIIQTTDESALTAKEGVTLFGYTDFLRQEIVLRGNISKAMLYETLIHELTHAFMFAYGFADNTTFNHEQICEFMGHYATDIVKIANKYIVGCK